MEEDAYQQGACFQREAIWQGSIPWFCERGQYLLGAGSWANRVTPEAPGRHSFCGLTAFVTFAKWSEHVARAGVLLVHCWHLITGLVCESC